MQSAICLSKTTDSAISAGFGPWGVAPPILKGRTRVFEGLKDALKRALVGAPVPAYVLQRADEARRCPECRSGYGAGERYCPGCHSTVPEWRFG